ncbi:helix-turn-helix domain-containing protein [Moellerella wisconsensis]|uniref:Helix-turn-helix domain-containing protein n=1 Tax=Moellerella wisconsensis TaxID=158849 RepID=A0ACD3Y3L2_9GAMM|nr:helix-turn-helix transcriptional regulator [Moellerella wisconsensis]UNH23022.1 helix-turn-helix domain-containing protein [Moellerella wisconsensis]UNH37707.1 helix-turn-helix domain-containing protein [Moellerella wisconsensis]UNH41258.1 helix-turn-helix domain-containing protein [Moellerella wisconsensis]WJW80755.1 helix-turn-helix transcriptional regulator [Moellerella wisconsensis]
MTSKASVAGYLGSELKIHRKSLGISGKELACRLNVSQQQISRYERGANSLNFDMLFLYFQALEMTGYEIESVFNGLIFNYYQSQ